MAPGGEQLHVLSAGGRERHYLVHAPAGAAKAPLPVVLFLHGAGATAAWSLEETGLGATADREGFLLVLPEGTRADPSRPPGFRDNPQVWNDGSARGPGAESAADDVAFIDALLDELPRLFAVDAARVYLTGFSNGAAMTFRLGVELSHRFAALAPVAGHCPMEAPRPVRPRPTLFLVGTEDPLLPLAGGTVPSPWGGVLVKPPVRATLQRWAAALGCAQPPRLLRDEGGVRLLRFDAGPAGAELVAYQIAGLGHHWPGGRGQLSQRIAGPPADRVRANDVIWSFFRDRTA